MARITIRKCKLSNATVKKYGWKPTYYEVRRNGVMIAYAVTKAKAEKLANRARKLEKQK